MTRHDPQDQLEALEAAESRQRQRAEEAEGERDKALSVLRQMVERWAPHSGLCCVAVDGKVAVTEASCTCEDLHKRARRLSQMSPYDAKPIKALRIGDLCRTRSGTPSRYVGGGKALGVSCQDSSLITLPATPATGGEDRLPLPTMREVFVRALQHATDEEIEVLLKSKGE